VNLRAGVANLDPRSETHDGDAVNLHFPGVKLDAGRVNLAFVARDLRVAGANLRGAGTDLDAGGTTVRTPVTNLRSAVAGLRAATADLRAAVATLDPTPQLAETIRHKCHVSRMADRSADIEARRSVPGGNAAEGPHTSLSQRRFAGLGHEENQRPWT
jgi:hypothetical protein